MRRKLAVAFCLFIILAVASAIFEVQQSFANSPQRFQSADFLGFWYNSGPQFLVAKFLITENAGTYTIHAVGITGFDFGTQTLSIVPPDAHAFCTFQSGNLDLRLQLTNATSMQIKESLEYKGTFIPNVEQFTKSSTTTSMRTSKIVWQSSDEQVGDQAIMDAYQRTTAQTLTLTLRNSGGTTIDLAPSVCKVNN